LKEVVKIITLEEYQYRDPITEFLRELYVDFDFEHAQKELAKAETVIENDFFLGEFKDEFLENARYLVTEAYCRIHQRIDIGYAAGSLLKILANRDSVTSLNDSTFLVTRVKSGSSTSFARQGWGPMRRST
jgi:hypothetical protein